MKWLYLIVLLAASAMAQQGPLPAGSHDPDEPAGSAPALSGAKPAGIAPALAAAEDKIEAHDFDRARPLLLGYLEQHPADARGLFDLGFVEDATGQQDAAERDYAKAIAADPKQFESHAALGLLYAQTGRADKALPELQTASELEPANHDERAKHLPLALVGLVELAEFVVQKVFLAYLIAAKAPSFSYGDESCILNAER